MKRGNKAEKPSNSLFSLRGYIFFFILVSLVSSSNILLLLDSAVLDEQVIRQNALVTFTNILILSLLFTLIDGFRRRWTLERPVNRILSTTRRLTNGEFDARIAPLNIPESMNEFDLIIQEINKMAEELGSVETLRTDFVSNVSHELKTPLSVMRNYGTMLRQPGLPEEKRMEYAREIVGASQRLSDLVSNFLKLNRLENQRIYPKAVVYDLSEQLRESLLAFVDIMDEKGLTLTTEITDDITVAADAELLSIVWNNLLSNAIKFTEAGGQITVRLETDGKDAAVSVADTGCGMSQKTGSRIFEKFYQGDTSHAAQGNGLGLALVKRVIDIVGSEILVESSPGKGSTFTVRLRVDAQRPPQTGGRDS